MNLAELTIAPSRLSSFEDPWRGPLALIALDREQVAPDGLRLPACPAIGIGDSAHPIAPRLDAVIEPPCGLESLARNVLSHPRAAAAFVDVLRVTAPLEMEEALTVESMAYAMLQGSAEHAGWRAMQNVEPQPSGRVHVERCGERLDVTLDRPAAGNAIDRQMRDALAEALALASLVPSLTQVRLLATGKAFSLGADLAEFGTTTDPASAHAIRHLTLPARAAIECADRLEAHVDGACVGAGLELAAFSSRVTATSRSWFQLPELAMGIIPGAGGCVSLPRRIGRQRTALMVLSGRRISASQALAWGLVDAIVDDIASDDGRSNVL